MGHVLHLDSLILACISPFPDCGSATVCPARQSIDPLVTIAVGFPGKHHPSTVLGMILACSIYALMAWLNLPSVVWLLAIAGLLGAVRQAAYTRSNLLKAVQTFQLPHLLLLFALFAAWLPMYFLPFYFGNMTWSEHGGIHYFFGQPDFVLHASLASELTHAIPPQVPFVAGKQLNYHIGMDLIAAVLSRYGGISTVDLVTRFCPTLFITLDVLAVFCLTRRITGSGLTAVAAAILTVLGEDMSYITGLLQHSNEIWAEYFFQAPTIHSIYMFNPMSVAVGILFASFLCLYRSMEDRNRGWVIAFAICAAALIQIKVFAFVHLIIAMAVVEVINLVAFRRMLFLRQGIVLFLVSLPLLLYTLFANKSGGSQFVWTWSSGLQQYVEPAFEKADWASLAHYPAIGVSVYLALTFGFRLAGIGELIKLFRFPKERPFHLLLAVFIVLGPVISLSSKIVPQGAPFGDNNAIWFMVQSKFAATLLAALALAGIWRRLKQSGRAAMIVLVAAISFPSTIDYVVKKQHAQNELEKPIVDGISFLNREARPGDVVVSHIDSAIVTLTQLRVPFIPLFP